MTQPLHAEYFSALREHGPLHIDRGRARAALLGGVRARR